MKKLKEFWASLEDVTTISKKELFLILTSCSLACLVFGLFFSPKKNIILGSYNGRSDSSYEDEDED